MSQESVEKVKRRSPKAGITMGLILVVAIVAIVMPNDYFGSVREEVVFQPAGADTLKTLEEVREVEDKILTSYELVDTTAGIYRIPLERALEIVAAEADSDSN